MRQPRPNGFVERMKLVVGVLLRESMVGLLLWTGVAQVAKVRRTFYLAAISITFLSPCRFELLTPMIPKAALMESMLLSLGGPASAISCLRPLAWPHGGHP